MPLRRNRLAPDALAPQLRHLRHVVGLTQQQLADKAGVSVQHIVCLEHGWGGHLSLGIAEALADALGCSLDVLAGRCTQGGIIDWMVQANGLQDWTLLGLCLAAWERRLIVERYRRRHKALVVPGRPWCEQGV